MGEGVGALVCELAAERDGFLDGGEGLLAAAEVRQAVAQVVEA